MTCARGPASALLCVSSIRPRRCTQRRIHLYVAPVAGGANPNCASPFKPTWSTPTSQLTVGSEVYSDVTRYTPQSIPGFTCIQGTTGHQTMNSLGPPRATDKCGTVYNTNNLLSREKCKKRRKKSGFQGRRLLPNRVMEIHPTGCPVLPHRHTIAGKPWLRLLIDEHSA